MDDSLILNQFRAAPYTYQVLRQQYVEHSAALSSARFWLESVTENSLGNDLCLPVAACTAINVLFGKRIIGDDSGNVRVGDFFRIMLPFHSSESTDKPAPYDQGWRVIDGHGNVYYHAIAAFMKSYGIYAYPVKNFSSISWPFREFSGENIVFAVSLNNKFVSLENPGCSFKIPGRHVVDVLGAENGQCQIAESYQFLKPTENPQLYSFPFAEVDKYLQYSDSRQPQGIVFSKRQLKIPLDYLLPIYIPDVIQYSLSLTRLRPEV
jgi:hypothetical protein